MLAIQRIGRAERQAYAVQTQRVALAQLQQVVDRRAAVGEIIVAVSFEPADRRPLAQQIIVMPGPQADSGTRRNRPRSPRHSVKGDGHAVASGYLVLPPTMRSHVPVGTLIRSFLSEL